MDALTKAMSETELAVVRDTEPDVLAGLGEDELIELHGRVRRSRDKYVGQYRRQASVRVAEVGARGAARPANRRAADRAEVFEAALARVSTALGRAARRSAAELKAERLAAARAARAASRRPASGVPDAASPPPDTPRRPAKSPARRKRDASTLAEGARRQAKRDAAPAET